MKVSPASRHARREIRVLGKKPIPRVNGIGAGDLRRVKDSVDAKVAVSRGIAAERDRLVSHAHVTGPSIALGKDRHRPEAEVAACANHAHRDLAAVGDEDLVQDPVDSTSSPDERRIFRPAAPVVVKTNRPRLTSFFRPV